MRDRDNELPVDVLLRSFLKNHRAFQANPLGEWDALVGPQVARYSQPKSLKKKILTISAYDSVWKHHLELNKEALLEKINCGRPEPLVEKIIIRVAEVPDELPVLNPNYRLLEKFKSKSLKPRKKKRPPLRRLTPEEKELLAKLDDPDLRAMGKKLLQRLPLE
ncbi:MAG: DUF721 domain-containing protein [Desulforhabdus sp.]|jgi:hypothetical protein|nr:DUF721 domain-containing protein [Desulforhabdus sp.]